MTKITFLMSKIFHEEKAFEVVHLMKRKDGDGSERLKLIALINR